MLYQVVGCCKSGKIFEFYLSPGICLTGPSVQRDQCSCAAQSLRVVLAPSSPLIRIILHPFLSSSVFVMLLTRIDNRSFASVNAWLEDTTSSTSFVTEKDMDSPKRTADYHTEEIRTPKRMQIFTDPEDTPRNTSLISHDSVDSLDSPAAPTDSTSKSNQSGRTNSIKNLSCLLMTKYPVKLSDNISEIPSMGQDLYKELFMCGQGQGILPSASKVCVVVEST